MERNTKPVRVHDKTHRRLTILAKREGRPMSEIVRRAVNVYEGKPA